MELIFFYVNQSRTKFIVNVNEKVYHPLTKKFTTPLAN